MGSRPLNWIGVVIAVLVGVGAILSGQFVYQLLGLVALFTAVAYAVADLRGRGQSPRPPEEGGFIPERSFAERFLPAVFLVAVLLVVIGMAVYAGQELGLW